MKTKEHSEQLREEVIEKYKSGEGYKKMSKALNIPWSSVQTILKKWKECVNLPRAGRPHKLSDRARRRLVREATKTPITTLKELQASAAEMGEILHTTTVPPVIHQSKLYGRGPLLKKTHIKYWLEFAKRHVADSMVKWKKILWSAFWPSDKTLCLADTKHCTSPHTHHPHCEAWWWHHYAVGMLLGSRPWKACKDIV